MWFYLQLYAIILRCVRSLDLETTHTKLHHVQNVKYQVVSFTLKRLCQMASNPVIKACMYQLALVEFSPCSGVKFRQQCYEWCNHSTSQEHNEFFKTHGVHWTELARLSYFDIVQCLIVDLIHNILLGKFKIYHINLSL